MSLIERGKVEAFKKNFLFHHHRRQDSSENEEKGKKLLLTSQQTRLCSQSLQFFYNMIIFNLPVN